MSDMGRAMLGTGERRAVYAAEAAIANPLIDDISMRGARALLISVTGGDDLTLFDVDEAASRIRQEVDDETNIILGATFEPALDGVVRVSVVATGVDQVGVANTDVETEPLSAPAIPFPESIEQRGVHAPHRSLLERLKSPLDRQRPLAENGPSRTR
jgi:cell division protein FtsZ